MHKILVTGASGYLAHRLLPIASRYGEVIGVARRAESVYKPFQSESLDLTDTDAVVRCINRIKPDAVIHAAAVNPGPDESRMDAVNHQASKTLAVATAATGSRLVMVSTDVVHGGDAAPYADNALPSPINTYGRTKARGEQAVMTHYPQAVIVRTGLIYGLELMDRGTRGFVDRLQAGEPLVLFNDVMREPVWADSLSEALCELAFVQREESGVMNVVGDEVMSRAQFARAMFKHWAIEQGGDISEQTGRGIDGLPMDLRCKCARAAALGFSMPGVTEVLSSNR